MLDTPATAKRTHPGSAWATLATFFRHCGESRRVMPFHFFLLFLDAVLQIAVPLVVRYVIDGVTRDPSGYARHHCITLIEVIVAGSVLFYLTAFTQHFLTQKISQSMGVRFQVDLFDHLQQLSADFYQRHHVGEITSRLTNDISQGVVPLYNILTLIFWSCSMLALILASVANISFPLLGGFLVILLAFAIATRFVSARVRKMNREVRDEAGRISARLTETISANTLIRAFAQESSTSAEIAEHSSAYLEKSIRTARFTIMFGDQVNAFLAISAPLIVLLVGAFFIGHGITVGALAATVLYWRTAAGNISIILNNLPTLYASFASMDRIFEFFRETPLVNDRHGAKPLRVSQGSIELRDIVFRYPVNDGGIVLNGINFTVPANTSLALVGESGAGKSTLVQLMLRFYDPTAGAVLIDGQDLREVTQVSLRRQLGLVMQETILLSGTIRENMQFAKPGATDAEIIEALKHAEAWDFVREMPEELDTALGERGVRLSGGQKQRLSIARVFLKNPPIVIFDEATSALDSITEQQIQQTMNRLYEGRTAIIIAHRLSTIAHCDNIIVLDKGRIIAAGAHGDLLTSCPRYQEMCARQSVGTTG